MGDGRIEIGITYVLDPMAFSDEDPSNYPFDPPDLRRALFFIVEENATGGDIYSGIGCIPVPLPATPWLQVTAVLASLACAPELPSLRGRGL